MPRLWDRNYDKKTLQAYTSMMGPLAGLRPFIYDDGRLRGMRGVDAWTGSGFRFTVWPDRALDIGPAWFKDKPIPWQHPGLGTPAHFEPDGLGWLRTFGGGLLTTCGLVHIGSPDEYLGQSHGLHGRIAHLPAENVRLWQEWRDEDYVLIVEGEIRQTVLFGENLLLKRRYETCLGSKRLTLKDTVINQGSQPTPHSLLYHCNFGFPLVNPTSRLIIEDQDLVPRTPAAAAGLRQHASFEAPQPGYEEQVFFHYPRVNADGFAEAALVNQEHKLGIHLFWLAKTMPVLTQWKMMGQGEYVCGLEPATHALAPYEELVEHNLPRTLAPGESAQYELTLEILEDFN